MSGAAAVKLYDVPAVRPHKICEACGAELWFVRGEQGGNVPVTAAGVNHYTNCPDPKRFSRGAKA